MAERNTSASSLLNGLIARDPDALRAFIKLEHNRLFQWIRSQRHRCLTDEDIDEIVAQSFHEVWQKTAQPVAEDFNLRIYLRMRANWHVRSRVREWDKPKARLNRTVGQLPPERADPKGRSPYEQLITSERLEKLDTAIAMLSDAEREVIQWARDHDPPDWDSFEKSTGIPAKTGRKRASIARAKLKKALKRYEGDAEKKGGSDNVQHERQTA